MARKTPKRIRLRHYTRKSSKESILEQGWLLARDQNKVFVERANRKPLSPRDAEDKYALDPGKGNAYVEFDALLEELEEQMNPRTGESELFLRGDLDLSTRNAEGFDNR